MTYNKSAENTKSFSIRSHLIAFSLVIIIPLALFSGVMLHLYSKNLQDNIKRRVSDHADTITEVVDSRMTTLIRLLADKRTCSLELVDLQDLQWILSHILQINSATLIYYDKNHKPVLVWGSMGTDQLSRDHSQDFSATLPTLQQVLISDLLKDHSGQYYNQISIPVICGHEKEGYLSLNISPQYWINALVPMKDFPGIRVGIVDRNARFIVSSLPGWEGQLDPDMADKKVALQAGTLKRTGLDGKTVLIALQKSLLSGWYIGIAYSPSILSVSLSRAYMIFAGTGIIIFLLSLVMAYFFGKRISVPLLKLAATAKQMSGRENINPLCSSVKEINEVSAELVRANKEIKDSYDNLSDSEERYRLATDVFQGAVIEYDGLTQTAHCSPRFYKMFGNDMVWPNTISDPDLLHFYPDDRQKVQKHLDRIFHSSSSEEETEYRIRSGQNTWIWIWDKVVITRDKQNNPLRVIGALLDITAHKRAEENLSLVVHELNHRVKNTLAIIQAIARNSIRAEGDRTEILKLFEERLVSLSRAHDLITQKHWEGARLKEVIQVALTPFLKKDDTRLVLTGPNLWITSQTALSLTLIFHELGTNATKYGALSNETGTIHLSWKETRKEEEGGQNTEKTEPVIEMEWREEGGPPILHSPKRRGFGSRLITRTFIHDPHAKAQIDYKEKGVVAQLCWTGIDQGTAKS